MPRKLPWFKFFPGDWLRDPELRRCSQSAKGAYIDMLCLMFECEERGVLATGGVSWTDEEIARAVGGDMQQTLSCLRELVEKGVVSRSTTGAVYCRRMVRDEDKRRKCSEAGKKGGGNPNLTYKGEPKGGAKRTHKGQEVRDQKSKNLPSEDSRPPTPELQLELEFVSAWNATEGVVKNLGVHLSDSRRRAFRLRLKDSHWDWRSALSKFPLKCTIGELEPWRPDVDWILKPDSVMRVLEGKYDWSKAVSVAAPQSPHESEAEKRRRERDIRLGVIPKPEGT